MKPREGVAVIWFGKEKKDRVSGCGVRQGVAGCGGRCDMLVCDATKETTHRHEGYGLSPLFS